MLLHVPTVRLLERGDRKISKSALFELMTSHVGFQCLISEDHTVMWSAVDACTHLEALGKGRCCEWGNSKNVIMICSHNYGTTNALVLLCTHLHMSTAASKCTHAQYPVLHV